MPRNDETPEDIVTVSHPILVEPAMDPDAYWDFDIGVDDELEYMYSDLLWDCADYVAHLAGVEDVPYDGGNVIPVKGPISEDLLRGQVRRWWIEQLGRRPPKDQR